MNENIQNAYNSLVQSYTFNNPPRCTGCHPPQPMTMVNANLNGVVATIRFKCNACSDLSELTVNFKQDGTFDMKWNDRPQF